MNINILVDTTLMRFLHTADSHLGYSAYSRLNEEGYNQREVDIYEGFRQVIDAALKHKVDFVIHAGDLFDTVRPNNRALSFAIDQVLRLSRANIPFVVISGNHDTPRLRETGSVFRLFEHIEHVHPIFKAQYEKIEVGDAVIHCIPQCMDTQSLKEQMKALKPKSGKKNLAMLHVGVVGISVFRTDELNEQVVDPSRLSDKMDYIALGHFHGYTKLAANAYYSGSTERLSFAEAEQEKGYIIGDLEGNKFNFHKMETRPMLDLKPVTCKPNAEFMQAIESRISGADIGGAIARLKVKDIPPHVYHGLDFRRLKELAAPALHFDMRYALSRGGAEVQSRAISFENLNTEFNSFMSNQPVEGLDKERLKGTGLRYLAEQLEQGVED
jgi:predicted phosphodiesterase